MGVQPARPGRAGALLQQNNEEATAHALQPVENLLDSEVRARTKMPNSYAGQSVEDLLDPEVYAIAICAMTV